jgi:uncharacterized protein (DUF2252 family)
MEHSSTSESDRVAADNGQSLSSVSTSPEELRRIGKALRKKCPRSAHAVWNAWDGRPDPVALLERSNAGRLEHLIPIRFGRMLQSPFAFYRGAASNMAADLAHTPVSGLQAQLCGDAHLCNFGAFATPERRVIFDINDLDETLPGPWEWDVKRLAASLLIASRHNGFDSAQAEESVLWCVRAYREAMREFSEMSPLEVWYARADVEDLTDRLTDEVARERIRKRMRMAHERDVIEHDFPKLATLEGRAPRVKDNPPLIYHPDPEQGQDLLTRAQGALVDYRASLQEDRRTLLDEYELKDVAIKVVGVGSVGTFCAVALFMANDRFPLFLQIKEARASVLELYLAPSEFANHGRRVISGYRLMQSASDLFLGWTGGALGRHFYVRQLRDMKVAPQAELFRPTMMVEYGQACGWTLARAHARSGPREHIAGYLGRGEAFDQAVAKFAADYADQSERDYEVFKNAVSAGRLPVEIA